MLIAAIVIVILILLYLLALRCRTGHPLLGEIRRWKYAHRGLHGNGVPENSMQAFRLALENGYGIELDIHLLADGNLAVMHDASLLRTAGVDVPIESLTTEELQNYSLEGTDEIIPTFREVLELFNGKAPLVVELKPINNNHAELTEKACKMLDDYNGLFCVESFDPRCIRWLRNHRPDILRGQLAHNSMQEGKGKIPFILRFLMTNLLSNFWNTPDFVAYRFCDRNRLSVKIARGLWKVQGVSWTLTSKEEFDKAVEENWIPIFEGFKP
jgi:glycerophosphoryl diester phosphodiesterase